MHNHLSFRVSFFLSFLAGFLLINSYVFAGAGLIMFHVVRSNGTGVADARIVAMLKGGMNSAVSTDKNGYAALSAIPDGTYTIEVTPLSGSYLLSAQREVELRAGETVRLDIALEEDQMANPAIVNAILNDKERELKEFEKTVKTLNQPIGKIESGIDVLDKDVSALSKSADVLNDTPDKEKADRLLNRELKELCNDIAITAGNGSESLKQLNESDDAISSANLAASKMFILTSYVPKSRNLYETIASASKLNENLELLKKQLKDADFNIKVLRDTSDNVNRTLSAVAENIKTFKPEFQKLKAQIKNSDAGNRLEELAQRIAGLNVPAFSTDPNKRIDGIEVKKDAAQVQVYMCGPKQITDKNQLEDLKKIADDALKIYKPAHDTAQKYADDITAFLVENQKTFSQNELDKKELDDALKEGEKTENKLKSQIAKREELIKKGGSSNEDAAKWNAQISKMKDILEKNSKSCRKAEEAIKSRDKQNEKIKQIDGILTSKLGDFQKCLAQ